MSISLINRIGRTPSFVTHIGKECLRRAVVKHTACNSNEILSMIKSSNIEVVSFDVFDTLIVRDVSTPKDIQRLLAREYTKHFEYEIDFLSLREEAESRARCYLGVDEVTIGEIYGFMPLPEVQRSWALNREIELEKAVCSASRGAKKLWKELQNLGYRLIITSDMYLPSSVIEEILRSSGYDGWEALYVSSETRCRKIDGKAYIKIIDDLEVNPESIVHIGDSIKADWIMPRRLGIQSILVPRKENTKYYNEKLPKWADSDAQLDYSVINAYINNHVPDNYGYFEHLGYEAIGPILYGFSKWLEDTVSNEGIGKIFFLTREGVFLKRAYETYSGGNSQIDFDLLRVSRRATSVPLLSDCRNFSEAAQVTRVPRSGAPITKVLSSWGIPYEVIEQSQAETNIEYDKNILEVSDNDKAIIFENISNQLQSVSLEQRFAINKYLDENGFKGHVAVVDVGWFGTIQSNLQSIRPSNHITGLYLASKRNYGGISRPKDERFFLYSSMYSPVGEKITSAVEVFEQCFITNEGTTTGYKLSENGHAVPISAKPERSIYSMEKIGQLQEAAIRFVGDFGRLAKALNLDMHPDACSAAYCKFIDPPSSEMIDEFSSLTITDTGIDDAPPFVTGSILHYIVNPSDFIRDFRGPGSKGVFLSSTFKLPLPWPHILAIMRKVEGQDD